jgi:spectinomycin phosphotransferase
MRDDPGLKAKNISVCLKQQYDLAAVSIEFLPIGYDPIAAAYKIDASDGRRFFLKLRFGPVNEASLLVPQALNDHGVRNVLAPLPTGTGALWLPVTGVPGCNGMLYPFIAGENAMIAGLTDEQWRMFGFTLRVVHNSGLQTQFRDVLPHESFALPSAALVRRMLALPDNVLDGGPAGGRVGSWWRAQSDRIRGVLARAEELGEQLRTMTFGHVLCHADIHAANILVGEDGAIWLIDWDGPLIAPRERDLLFVIGSTIARAVEPHEEERFFEGYGAAEVDPTALAYYRYERAIEDIGVFAEGIFLNPALSNEARAEDAAMLMNFFKPGGDLDRAESITHQGRRLTVRP